MAAPTKTEDRILIAHQAVTHSNIVKGTEIDVGVLIRAFITMWHASVEATANTNPGKFIVQALPMNAGEEWATIYEFGATVSTADTEAMTATEGIGETVLAVASTTGFAAEDKLYIQDTGTLANSEWRRCRRIVTNISIDLIDGLTAEKDSSDVIWNDADIFNMSLDLTPFKRLRVDFIHEGAVGANCHIKAIMSTWDTFA